MKKTIDPYTGRLHRAAILTEFPAPLFAPEAHAKADGPATSKEAARAVSSRADAQCAAVLDILRSGPVAGADFYARCLANGIQNPRARVSDLRGRGHRIEVAGGFYCLIGGAQ